MYRLIVITASFSTSYYLFPSLKAIAQIITLTMITAVSFVVAAYYLFKILGDMIKLSKNDNCKIYQEKDGNITRVD